MTTVDRQGVGAVGPVGHVEIARSDRSARIYRPDHRCGNDFPQLPGGDEVANGSDRGVHPGLESHDGAHSRVFRCLGQLPSFLLIEAEWPLAVDILTRRDGGGHQFVVERHSHRDHHQVDVCAPDQGTGIAERVRRSKLAGRRVGRFLTGRRHRSQLELRQRGQGGQVPVCGPRRIRVRSDDTDADSLCRHALPSE